MNLSSLARRPLGFVVSTCGASLALLSLLAVACGGDNVSVGGADRAALGTPPAESCEGQACDTAPSAPAPSASAPSALPSCEGKACGTDCTAAGTSDYHWCDAQGACVPGGGPTAGAPLCTPSSPPSPSPSCKGKACGTDCTAAGTTDWHWCDKDGACVPGGGPTAGAPLCR